VAKIDFTMAQDGVSYTFSITPQALGNERADQIGNLTQMMG
jgi:formate C-acetyltransferase